MEYTIVNMQIPQDIFYEINSLPIGNKTLNEKLKLNLAIGLFVSKDISLAKAAELSNNSLAEFIMILNEFNVPVSDYSEVMLCDDLNFVRAFESENTRV